MDFNRSLKGLFLKSQNFGEAPKMRKVGGSSQREVLEGIMQDVFIPVLKRNAIHTYVRITRKYQNNFNGHQFLLQPVFLGRLFEMIIGESLGKENSVYRDLLWCLLSSAHDSSTVLPPGLLHPGWWLVEMQNPVVPSWCSHGEGGR